MSKPKQKRNRHAVLLETAISATESACYDYTGRREYYEEHSACETEEAQAQAECLKEFKRRLRQIAYFIDLQLKK